MTFECCWLRHESCGPGQAPPEEDKIALAGVANDSLHDQDLRALAQSRPRTQDDRSCQGRRAIAVDVMILVPMLTVAFIARSAAFDKLASLAECSTATALVVSFVLHWRAGRRASGAGDDAGGGGSATWKPYADADWQSAAALALLARFEGVGELDGGFRMDAKTCRRFLIAWKGDVEGAAFGLQKYVEWRKKVRPAEITVEDVKTEHATKKGYAHGIDRLGHPVFWAFVSRHDRFNRDLEETVKLILFTMEDALRIGQRYQSSDQICLVFDLSGFGSKSMDIEVVKRLFLALARFYPERLGRVLLWNAPVIFNGFWQLISPFIDPVSFRKIKFVGEQNIVEAIDRAMLPDEIVARLGLKR
eukprot:CAMPEP_0203868750 /NCGR_PEP_ID=MMETSP0359-20131031/17295_1 /ASSEMBLY_ACC=CAM_ASM_000338 /TAXON_ID=268821 /ORGANISM="Scrippsiella Hangoei, Strain SHTV-5" /LENGTH=360 /DNA_ID=CAMNT_0050787227 /DNA_START=59 /DNA_END=1141 /DNA_ORIENTATION=+